MEAALNGTRVHGGDGPSQFTDGGTRVPPLQTFLAAPVTAAGSPRVRTMNARSRGIHRVSWRAGRSGQ